MDTRTISWDTGTAYDMFVSLHILHNPEHYHLRPTWASGMRSRLPSAARETLELAEKTVSVTWPRSRRITTTFEAVKEFIEKGPKQ